MSRLLAFPSLSEMNRGLVSAALDASGHAYAPYSGFAVGAALRTRAGAIHAGANLENASYPVGICAEVSAVAAANAAGEFDIEAIAVVGHKFTQPPDSAQVVTPCGRCRQIIFEAGQISGVDIEVLSCNGDLSQIIETNISELLPSAFGPANLGLDKVWTRMRVDLAERVRHLRAIVPKIA